MSPAQGACANQNAWAVGNEGPKDVGLIVPEPPFGIYSCYQIMWVLVCQNPYFVYTLKRVFNKA